MRIPSVDVSQELITDTRPISRSDFVLRRISVMIILATVLPIISIRAFGQSSWSVPRPIDFAATRDQVSPLIAVSREGVVAIICQEGYSTADSGMHVIYRSTNGGSTFIRGGILKPFQAEYGMNEPYSISFDTNDALWVLWGWDWYPGGLPVGSYLELSKSLDNGATFETILRHWRGLILRPSRMIIDDRNSIHLLRDSVVAGEGPRIIYTKLLNADPSSRFDTPLPFAQNADNLNNGADLAVFQDIIHYVNRVVRYTGTTYEFTIEYSKSLDGGFTFSSLSPVDTISPPSQLDPRITANNGVVLVAYHLGDSPDTLNTYRAVLSTNAGDTFGEVFAFGSHQPGQSGRLISESSSIHCLYATWYGQNPVSVYNRFTDPASPPLEVATFDSLYGDLAIGRLGGKYGVFKKQNNRSVLFSSKDIPTEVLPTAPIIPSKFSVQASPNPFNSSTLLYVDLPEETDLKIEVYDMLGRLVHYEEYHHLLPGQHRLTFATANFSTGVYILQIVGQRQSSFLKILLLK